MTSCSVFMLEPDAVKLLGQYGISYPRHCFVPLETDPEQAMGSLEYPVVMKVVSPGIIHKSDSGGIIKNISSAIELKEACHTMLDSVGNHAPDAEIEGFLLCEQAQAGLEVIVGTVVDEVFGQSIMFGLGGIFVELLDDVVFRICPIGKEDALEMIQEIRGSSMLNGARGTAQLDIESLADLIVAVSRLVTENQAIQEVDLNPVRVYESGVSVLDARIITQKH